MRGSRETSGSIIDGATVSAPTATTAASSDEATTAATSQVRAAVRSRGE